MPGDRPDRTSVATLVAAIALASLTTPAGREVAAAEPPVGDAKPSIVIILADDMGWGDARVYNPDGKVPTPAIDRLAAGGMRFTNAHSPGTTCVPARYGLLTGRYPFRVDTGAIRERSLIEPGRTTLASLLRGNGYRTACIGKWHLGFDGWTRETTDYSRPLRGGPVDRGFDTFFGMHASLDIPPYFFIDGDRCVAAPTETVAASASDDVRPVQGAFWRAGKLAPGFRHADVNEEFTRRAVELIRGHGVREPRRPLFLYLALAAPHTPWLPAERFVGRSGAGDYGDFVAQVDDTVGRVDDALADAGMADDTLVFFLSDNGPVWFAEDVARYGHRSTHFLRGIKADAWEGGHRMPCIARWPRRVAAGAVSAETICFTDLMATFAALVGEKLPTDAGEDSYDLLPVLLERSRREAPLREATIIEDRVVLSGGWKLILGAPGGFVSRRWSGAQGAEGTQDSGLSRGALYRLADDPSEEQDLFGEHPEVVERLRGLLEKYRSGRSAPLP